MLSVTSNRNVDPSKHFHTFWQMWLRKPTVMHMAQYNYNITSNYVIIKG